MTPSKLMLPHQGPQMMVSHNQIMEPQGQVLLQQNPTIEQTMTNQVQGNQQQFNPQNQFNIMLGPAQIMRRPSPTCKETRCNLQDRCQNRCCPTSLQTTVLLR